MNRLHPDKWLDLTGKTGLDCFGLARTIFSRMGADVAFRVDSSPQWERIDAPEPGALVMIGPEHVGVCLDDREYIHVRQGHAVAVARLSALKRAGQLSGLYRHVGRLDAPTFAPEAGTGIRVVHIPAPVADPGRRDWQIVPWYEGITLGAVAPPRANAVMLADGAHRLEGVSCRPIGQGETVLFVTLPGEIVTATGALTLAGSIIVGVGLSLLALGLQLLLASAIPATPKEEEQPTFDLHGIRNTAVVGIAQPVVYGTRKTGGNFIAAFTKVGPDGSSILYLLTFVSRGPIESIAGLTEDADELTGDDIPDSIEIDGNAAKNYDCAVSVRLGNSDQEPIPGFNETTTAFPQTVTLVPSAPFTYSTTTNVTGADVQVTFPTGLVDVTNSGAFVNRTVKFYVRHRLTGTTTWTEAIWTVTEARTRSFTRQFTISGLERNKYDIQIERFPGDGVISAPYPESAPKFFSQSVLSAVNEIAGDRLSYPGRALIGIRIRATEQLAGSIPLITSVVKGKKVWIWDGQSTTAPTFAESWTDNPAWVDFDIATNPDYGLGRSGRLTIDNIDLDSFADWADLCDDLVDDGRGGETERARCDAVIDSVSSGWQTFLSIAHEAWAKPYIAGNKIRLSLLAPSSPVFLFGPGNCRDVKISTLGRSQRPNAVEVQYANEESNYDGDQAKRVDEAAVFTAGDPENVETISTLGVTRPIQAYTLAQFRSNWHRLNSRVATWIGGPDSIHLLPGEVVALVAPGVFDGIGGRVIEIGNNDEICLDRAITVTAAFAPVRIQHAATDTIETAYIQAGTYARYNPITVFDSVGGAFTWATSPAIGTKYVIESLATTGRRLFRIDSIGRPQGLDRPYTGTAYDADVFNDAPGDLEDFTDEMPNVKAIPAAATVFVRDAGLVSCDGGSSDALDVVFDMPEAWQRAEVWYRVNSSTSGGWRFAGWSRGALTIPVACGQSYEVAVVGVSAGGTRQQIEDGARASVYIRGSDTAPDAPSALAVTVTAAGLLHVTLTPPDDASVAAYEIRYGTTWAGSVRLAREAAAEWTGPCPFVGTETLRARSIGRNGLASDDEVTASATHTAAASVFTVDLNSDEHAAFGGTKTDTVVTGSELALDTGDLSGTYVTPDLTAAGGTAQIHLRARCDLADVAMTWDEAAFTWGSALAGVLTWGTAVLTGREVDDVRRVTWGTAGFSWGGLQASLRTWAGPTDVRAALTPTIAYDVDTGSGFSGSYTEYVTPPTVASLDGVRSRVTLRRPHTRYDPRLVEYNTTTLSTASTGGGGGDPWDFDEGDAGATYGTGTIDFDEGSA